LVFGNNYIAISGSRPYVSEIVQIWHAQRNILALLAGFAVEKRYREERHYPPRRLWTLRSIGTMSSHERCSGSSRPEEKANEDQKHGSLSPIYKDERLCAFPVEL
jgi:hypothetical protein